MSPRLISPNHSSDLNFVLSKSFIFKVAIIVAISSFPLYIIKSLHRHFNPAAYSKISNV